MRSIYDVVDRRTAEIRRPTRVRLPAVVMARAVPCEHRFVRISGAYSCANCDLLVRPEDEMYPEIDRWYQSHRRGGR
jgi:hypothetical protein